MNANPVSTEGPICPHCGELDTYHMQWSNPESGGNDHLCNGCQKPYSFSNSTVWATSKDLNFPEMWEDHLKERNT